MKVALVVNGFPVLSETFIYNQATHLRARGVDVSIVTAGDHGDADAFKHAVPFEGPVVRALLDRVPARMLGRTLRRLTHGSARDLRLAAAARARYGNTPRALRAWLLALPLIDFDIVHLEYSGLAVAWLDALPLIAPTKIVVSCRGTAERITPLIDAARPAQLRGLFAIANRVHCVSHAMVRTCECYGLTPDKAFVNHPAVHAARFQRTTPYPLRREGPYKLLSTGRIIWAKGLEFGLMALRDVLARGIDATYDIIGKGPDEERIRYAAHDLGLADRVVFRGALSGSDVKAALEAADLYLLPSVSEGISNAALEAMAMEVPVITSDAGGMPEAIIDGESGVVVEARQPTAMADAIAALLRDPDRRNALGQGARRRVLTAFSMDRQTATFMAEYEALLEGHHPHEQSR